MSVFCFVPETLLWADSFWQDINSAQKVENLLFCERSMYQISVCVLAGFALKVQFYTQKKYYNFFFLIRLMYFLFFFSSSPFFRKKTKQTEYKCSFLLM